MTKYILTTIMMAMLTLCAPVQVRANAAIEIIENDLQPTAANITVNGGTNGGTIRVSGANGKTMYVYNLAGVRIHSIKVEGADRTYDLNLSKGCYIIKVGTTVRKVSLK